MRVQKYQRLLDSSCSEPSSLPILSQLKCLEIPESTFLSYIKVKKKNCGFLDVKYFTRFFISSAKIDFLSRILWQTKLLDQIQQLKDIYRYVFKIERGGVSFYSTFPTDLFTILEVKNDVPELHKIPDREALKLRKGQSGYTTSQPI